MPYPTSTVTKPRRTVGVSSFQERRGVHSSRPSEPTKPQANPPSRLSASLRPGVSMLMYMALVLLTLAGIAEVRARAEILERGAQLGELSAEHARLQDEKRRLEAEQAFLRHPEQVARMAAERFHMVPADPERVRQIHVHPTPSAKKTVLTGLIQQATGARNHE